MMQHIDFNEESATLVGSPLSARAHCLSGMSGLSDAPADFRASSGQPAKMLDFNPVPFPRGVTLDPAMVESRLRMSIRALPSTESRVNAIAQDLGLTFWGEAVARVLSFAFRAGRECRSRDLRDGAPPALLVSRAAVRAGGMNAPIRVRQINTPLTADLAECLDRAAARNRLSPATTAALILHRTAADVAAIVRLS